MFLPPQVKIAQNLIKFVPTAFMVCSIIMGCILLSAMPSSSGSVMHVLSFIMTLGLPFISYIIPKIHINNIDDNKKTLAFYILYAIITLSSMIIANNAYNGLDANVSSNVKNAAKSVQSTSTGIYVIAVLL